MKKIDYRSVNGQLLNTFLTILETASVSSAAVRLGVSQSSVSHALARLRTFFGDPLFVRSGQSLSPTQRAISLKEPVQRVLDGLKELTHERPFDPRMEDSFFIVAANDMQRDLIFPQLLREISAERIPVAFEFIPSGHPTPAMLRDSRCHLALTPFPPDASDIVQKLLLRGNMMCFYDGSMRTAPRTWEEYCSADHLTVRFPDGGTSLRALTGVDKGPIREAKISVPNFNSLPSFLKGTEMIATEMDLMKLSCLSNFEMAPLPLKSNTVAIYMCWHKRNTNEPSHAWLRARIEEHAALLESRSAGS